MTDNGEARASDPSLSRRAEIPSTPVAFFDFNSFSALRTSDTVICEASSFAFPLQNVDLDNHISRTAPFIVEPAAIFQ